MFCNILLEVTERFEKSKLSDSRLGFNVPNETIKSSCYTEIPRGPITIPHRIYTPLSKPATRSISTKKPTLSK